MNCASNQRLYTGGGELLEEVRQIALDVMGYPDEPDSWFYSIGCVLGDMSLQVSPLPRTNTHIVPVDQVGTNSAHLRLVPAKNNQMQHVRWAREYEL